MSWTYNAMLLWQQGYIDILMAGTIVSSDYTTVIELGL